MIININNTGTPTERKGTIHDVVQKVWTILSSSDDVDFNQLRSETRPEDPRSIHWHSIPLEEDPNISIWWTLNHMPLLLRQNLYSAIAICFHGLEVIRYEACAHHDINDNLIEDIVLTAAYRDNDALCKLVKTLRNSHLTAGSVLDFHPIVVLTGQISETIRREYQNAVASDSIERMFWGGTDDTEIPEASRIAAHTGEAEIIVPDD